MYHTGALFAFSAFTSSSAWLTGTPRRLVGVRTAGGVVTVGLGGALLLSSLA